MDEHEEELLRITQQMYCVANEQKALWRYVAVALKSLAEEAAHGPVGASRNDEFIQYIGRRASYALRLFDSVMAFEREPKK